jgi:hypothetical protein
VDFARFDGPADRSRVQRSIGIEEKPSRPGALDLACEAGGYHLEMKGFVDESVRSSLEAFNRSGGVRSPDNEKERKITMNSVFADHSDQLDA